MRLLLALLLLGLSMLVGCAPSVSPLYRDYNVDAEVDTSASADAPPAVDGTVYARLREALAEAGWTETAATAPNAIATEPREFGNWGLYRVLVSLDVIPIGERHVRVHFHPIRRYVTGGRSKISYLGSGLRAALLPDLNEALEAYGFYPLGTPRERDEAQVDGT